MTNSTNYDIVGDIHGHANVLKALLTKLGYETHAGGYRHADRKLLFVGDLIDRGPGIKEVISIVRSTVDAGNGVIVMGNHEYNAIAFHTPIPGAKGHWFRDHSDKNLHQHQATLNQLSSSELADSIAWFRTLPVHLDLGVIRAVHAAWRDDCIGSICSSLDSLGNFNAEFLTESETKGSELHSAIEDVLKGPELKLPANQFILDKGGQKRDTVRIKWFQYPKNQTYRELHLGSDEVPDVSIDPTLLSGMAGYPDEAPPVFIGHYWLTGQPQPLAHNVACTDYSVAKGGKLVAYRWNGEQALSKNNFHWVGK